MSVFFYFFLSLMSLSCISFSISCHAKVEPTEASIEDLHQALKNQTTTCEQLILNYITRIQMYNLVPGPTPPINALTQINPYVIDQAKALDEHFSQTQQLKGALHCVPMILKDNIDSFDTETSAGSFALIGNQPNQDAFLVKQLRAAGALVLAKGAMDEFGWGLFGLSSRTGRVGNVYDTMLSPGGSSSGVAAAVSANFAVIGIGTDNSGSIRIPAVFNGIMGLRPSTGRVSQHGVFPMGNLDAVAGPITRNIKDMTIVLNVIAKQDRSDPKTQDVPQENNYLKYLSAEGLRNKRIGIVRQIGTPAKDIEKEIQNTNPFTFLNSEHLNLLDDLFLKLKNSGAIIVDNVYLPDFDNDRQDNQAGEYEDVNAYFSKFPGTRKNFQDICMSNRTRVFGDPETCLKFIQTLPKKQSKSYKQVLNIFKKNKDYVEKVMDEFQLDALLMPVSRQGGPTYDPFSINTWFAPLASNAGLPSLAFVAGFDSKQLPVGVELIGRQFQEGILLGMVYAYEKHYPVRIQPHLKPASKRRSYSIAEMNNLFTQLGATTFEQFPKNDPKKLTPLQFKDIFNQIITNK